MGIDTIKFILLVLVVLALIAYIGGSIYLIVHQSRRIEQLYTEQEAYIKSITQLEKRLGSQLVSNEQALLSTSPPKSFTIQNQNQYVPDRSPVNVFVLTKGYQPDKNHLGIDLAGRVGDPVFAAGSGVIENVILDDSLYGKTILIDHLNGCKSFYAHNDSVLVEAGKFVRKGEKIAELGNTGKSSAPHLHFEIIVNSERIDPEPMIKRK